MLIHTPYKRSNCQTSVKAKFIWERRLEGCLVSLRCDVANLHADGRIWPEIYTKVEFAALTVPGTEKVCVQFLALGFVNRSKAGKGVSPMTLIFGHEPGTMNWLTAVYANCGAPPVRKGAAEATFFCRKR